MSDPAPLLAVEEAIRLANDVAARAVRPPLTFSVAEVPGDLIELKLVRKLSDETERTQEINIERCYTPLEFQRGVAACWDHLQRLDARAESETPTP